MSDQKALLESIRDIMSNIDDDVLVLTQKVNADGSVINILPNTPATPEVAAIRPEADIPPPPPMEAREEITLDLPSETGPMDILGEIDAILTEPQPEAMPEEPAAVAVTETIAENNPEAEPPHSSLDDLFNEPEPQAPAPAPMPEPVFEQPVQKAPEIIQADSLDALFSEPQPEVLLEEPQITAPEPLFEPVVEAMPEPILEQTPEPEPILEPPAPEPIPEPEINIQINQSETIIELELAESTPEPIETPVLKEEQMENIESLLSNESAGAAKSSIHNLMEKVRIANEPKTDPSAAFRSGETVENLVMEMLKPMLKEWMDNNLPILVESIVQKEIQKITAA